jgi:hypothetical protein
MEEEVRLIVLKRRRREMCYTVTSLASFYKGKGVSNRVNAGYTIFATFHLISFYATSPLPLWPIPASHPARDGQILNSHQASTSLGSETFNICNEICGMLGSRRRARSDA